MVKGRLFILSGISLSLLLIITASTLATKRVSTFSNASSGYGTYSSLFSANNSYIFTSPITAMADGESAIRITVMLLNSQGLGIGGQRITVKSIPSLIFNYQDALTDGYGKVTFDAVSNTPGDYTIEAYVSNASLKQQVSISFR